MHLHCSLEASSLGVWITQRTQNSAVGGCVYGNFTEIIKFTLLHKLHKTYFSKMLSPLKFFSLNRACLFMSLLQTFKKMHLHYWPQYRCFVNFCILLCSNRTSEDICSCLKANRVKGWSKFSSEHVIVCFTKYHTKSENTRKYSVVWSTITTLTVSSFQQYFFVENQSDGV